MIYSIVPLGIVWIAVFYRAYLIYKQKMGPHYETLPALRKGHENLGYLWLLLLLINLALNPSIFCFLMPSSVIVVITGINLIKNKPTAVFVHVGFALLTTAIALGALLKVVLTFTSS
jgi:hypothetical protein